MTRVSNRHTVGQSVGQCKPLMIMMLASIVPLVPLSHDARTFDVLRWSSFVTGMRGCDSSFSFRDIRILSIKMQQNCIRATQRICSYLSVFQLLFRILIFDDRQGISNLKIALVPVRIGWVSLARAVELFDLLRRERPANGFEILF